MGKTLAGPLPQDSLGTYFDAIVDPATGTTYAKRAVNLHTSANGDYADQAMVLYDASGNPITIDAHGSAQARLLDSTGTKLLPDAAALSDGGSLPTTSQLGVVALGYDGTHTQILRVDSHKSFQTVQYGSDGNVLFPAAVALSSDGVAAPTTSMIGAVRYEYNNSTFDRVYTIIEGTLLASAARTASVNSPNQVNRSRAPGVVVALKVTAASGTGGLQVQVGGIDPVSGSSYGLHTLPAAITATGIYAYEVRPGASGSSGSPGLVASFSVALPRTWIASVVHGDASSYTYSLSYSYTS